MSVVVRVAKYRRRSTDAENQPYSIEAQDARLDPYITSQEGWQLVATYGDDKSGATLDRPDLQRTLRDARLGRYDVLLVYRVDRLSRSIRGLLDIVDTLDKAGVAFRSASEHFDTHSPVGRMTMQLLAVFAEYERAIIIDRVVAGMERKAAKGGWTAGSHPFGYTTIKDPITGKGTWLVPNEHAGLVRVIFELYGTKRLGANAIATWLNEHGHRTRHGKPWSHVAVLTVLRNRAYIGEVYFRGTWYPAPHPHLVDPELFETVQRVLAERGEDWTRRASNGSEYLLASLAKCANCGKRYVGNAATGRSQRYRYYTCYTRHRYGTDACPAERLPADDLEAALTESLLQTYQRTDLLDDAIAQTRARVAIHSEHHHAELASIADEIAKINAGIDRYLTAFERGTMSDETCGHRVAALEARRDQLRAREDELADTLGSRELTILDEDALADLRAQIVQALRTSERTTVKALLKTLVAEVIVTDRYAIQPIFRVPVGNSRHPEGGEAEAAMSCQAALWTSLPGWS